MRVPSKTFEQAHGLKRITISSVLAFLIQRKPTLALSKTSAVNVTIYQYAQCY